MCFDCTENANIYVTYSNRTMFQKTLNRYRLIHKRPLLCQFFTHKFYENSKMISLGHKNSLPNSRSVCPLKLQCSIFGSLNLVVFSFKIVHVIDMRFALATNGINIIFFPLLRLDGQRGMFHFIICTMYMY